MRLVLSGLSFVLLAACAGVTAAPAPKFNNPPPGAVVQDVVSYLSGEAMNSKWHVVASRVLLGKQFGKENVYQWYLSIYAPAENGWTLAFRSPGSGNNLLSVVRKAKTAQMYFPLQNLKIVGTGELEQLGVQDVVVQIHETGADCGGAIVGILGADSAMHVHVRANAFNPCELTGSVVKNGSMQAVRLSGPYYSKTAPLCCPTKPKAGALLRYSSKTRKWSVSPNYFQLH